MPAAASTCRLPCTLALALSLALPFALPLSIGCQAEVSDPNAPAEQADVAFGGHGEGSTGDDPPPACGLVYDDPGACESCFESSCCDTGRACVADGDCVALLTCLSGCGSDSTCGKACTGQHTQGTTLLRAVLDCASAKCSSACPK